MFINVRKNEDVLLDLSGSYEWIRNREFRKNLATLANKKNIILISDHEIEEIIPEIQFENFGDASELEILVVDNLDNDQSGVLIITNNTANISEWLKSGYSVVFLKTNKLENYEIFDLMPDEIWDLNDFEKYAMNKEFSNSYFSEYIGFPGISDNNIKLPIKKIMIPNTNLECDLIFTGRYFTLNDNRNYIHPLSRAIIGFKNNLDNFGDAVKRIFGELIDDVLTNTKSINCICVVPPRPGNLSRFKGIDEYKKSKIKVNYNILYSKENYESPKEYADFKDKYNCVFEKIGINGNVSGHILLIDDVFTSGATTLECARVLYGNGASKVTILPLAYTQKYEYSNQYVMPVIFNLDGNEYHLSFRRSDSQVFWSSKNNKGGYLGRDYAYLKDEYLEYHGVWTNKLNLPPENIDFHEIEGFIFDLDNTLVKTDDLEIYRNDKSILNELSAINKEHIIISPETIIKLKEQGIKIGIVTSSPREYAEKVLGLVGYSYDCLVAAKDTLRSKPQPDPFIKCGIKLNIEPSKIVTVGDLESDITAGKHAGMYSLLVHELFETGLLDKIFEFEFEF